ncbi:ribonuclease domain-containing protein [Mycoplasmatota bacterium WC30]
MKSIYRKYKWFIYITSVILFFLFMVLAFTTKIIVTEDESYYTKKEVSLYILEYKKLPDNFIMKEEATNEFTSYYIAIEEGYNIGGDTFRYYGTIITMTSNTSLKECDIYINRDKVIEQEKRGTYRLVFSTDGSEVFYTRNHYVTFSRMTVGKIQSTSTFFWIIFILYDIGLFCLFIRLIMDDDLNKEEPINSARKILYIFFTVFTIPFVFCYIYIRKGMGVIKK